MNLNIAITTISLFFSVFVATAQPTVGSSPAGGLDMNTSIGGFIQAIDVSDYKPQGNVYLPSNWAVANLGLKNGRAINGILVRVNLQTDKIEIKDNSKIKIFSLWDTEYIDLIVRSDSSTRYYNNPFSWKYKDMAPVVGLFRFIEANQEETKSWRIVERSFLKTTESTYIKALDAGTPSDRLEVVSEYYIENNSFLYKTSEGKKKFIQGLGLKSQIEIEVGEFIKTNKINHKEINDLSRIVAYLNSKDSPKDVSEF